MVRSNQTTVESISLIYSDTYCTVLHCIYMVYGKQAKN